jgi:hypothetical protein
MSLRRTITGENERLRGKDIDVLSDGPEHGIGRITEDEALADLHKTQLAA